MITLDDKKEIQELIEKAFNERQNGNKDYYLNQRDKIDLVEKINFVKNELAEKINDVKTELSGVKLDITGRIGEVKLEVEKSRSEMGRTLRVHLGWIAIFGLAIMGSLIGFSTIILSRLPPANIQTPAIHQIDTSSKK